MMLDMETTLSKWNKVLSDFFSQHVTNFFFWLIVIVVFIVFLVLIKLAFKD